LAVANYGGYDSNTGDWTNGGVSVLLGMGDGTFQNAVNYDAGVRSAGVAVGDFNGDGIPDLAVANPSNFDIGTVSVLMGKGDGTFQKAVDLPVGRPSFVAVGDLNGDGIPDLVVSGSGTSHSDPIPITVLLGNGDGTFQPGSFNLGLPTSAAVFAVGDFNSDGKSDLAVAYGSTIIAVFVNAGLSASPNPTFAEIADFPVAFDSFAVVVGDFNDDGKPDLVANCPGINIPNGVGSVVLLLGKGDGTFQRTVYYDAGAPTTSLATGDFNGDGTLDLAAGNAGSYDSSNGRFTNSSISVLMGKGDGTFLEAVKLAAVSASFAVGDFNNDGKSDLAVCDYTNSSVSVLLGNGDGTFQTAVEYGAGPDVGSVGVGDFNGDGRLDLAISNYTNGSVSVLLGKGDGTFQAAVEYRAGPNAGSVAVADFNLDSKLDLAISNLGVYDLIRPRPITYELGSDTYTNSSVSVLLGNGDGTFQVPSINYVAMWIPISPPLILGLKQVAVGDYNGDGKPDFLVLGRGISVLLGKGDGTFQRALSYDARPNGYSVAVADFNGDGRLDFVTIRGAGSSDVASVWLNTSCSAGHNLAIARSGSAFTLSWPFPSSGYVLEASTSLSPATWKAAAAVPVNNNGRWEVTTPANQSQGYFRLRKP
jgi:hypothetical protein